MRALLLGSASLIACSSATRTGFDATAGPDGDARDVPVDPGDAPISTCSELTLTRVTASPGRTALAYPGSTLRLEGTHLDEVTVVRVGAVGQAFVRNASGALTTTVPPLLESGTQTVVVANDRCSAGAAITVSRLLGVASGAVIELFDLVDFAHVGSLAPDVGTVTFAQFTLDGLSVFARGSDARGRVVRVPVGGGAVTPVVATSDGPFVIAQGNLQPTTGLLVAPGVADVQRFDSFDGSVAPYPTPASQPVGVATTLEGFDALLLDDRGAVFTGHLPFAPGASWQPMVGWTTDPAARAMALAQAPHIGVLLGALSLQHEDQTSIVALDTTGGHVGAATVLPGGVLPAVRFVSGDVVWLDTTHDELVAVDITDLVGDVWRIPLAMGETATDFVGTVSSASLYTVGALVLHPTASGVPEADVLHVVDFETEPPVEGFVHAVAGARGVLGVAGTSRPLVVWTATRVMEFAGAASTAPPGPSVDVPGGVSFVFAQP